jgi:hypothetical protein
MSVSREKWLAPRRRSRISSIARASQAENRIGDEQCWRAGYRVVNP